MNRTQLLGVATAVAVLSGCSSSQQRPAVTPSADQSGFFSDAVKLRAGGEGEPGLVYRMPNSTLAKFDKVILEPVEVWRGEGFEGGLSRDEVQFLADYLFTRIYMRLDQDYDMVSAPDATTMRVRVAYTQVGGENQSIELQSGTTPRPNLIPQFQKLHENPPRFQGSSSVELAIRDAESGVTFFAAIERKDLAMPDPGEDGFGWDDLENELKFDADRVGHILCRERSGGKGAGCPRPVRGR
jgi:hypothetical protein